MPLTEGLVFSSSDPYGEPNEKLSSEIRFGGGITTISSVAVYSQLEEKLATSNNEANQLNRLFLTAGGYPGFAMSFGEGRRFAVGFTPGVIVAGIHADATLRTVEKVFLTVNHNLNQKSTELIVQRPIIERNGGGLSLGLFFRNQHMQLIKENEQLSFTPTFKVKWYGIRLMGQQPILPQNNRIKARGYINAGLADEYNSPLISVGMSIAID